MGSKLMLKSLGIAARVLIILGLGLFDCFLFAQQSIQSDKELTSKINQLASTLLGKDGKVSQENLFKIIETNPDVMVMNSKNHPTRASWLCQVFLLGSDKNSQEYKKQEAYVKKQFDVAKTQKDSNGLYEIVRNGVFCKSGLDACMLLGDRAFEQSKIEEAEYWWNLPIALYLEAQQKSNLDTPLFFEQLPLLRARLVASSLVRDGFGKIAKERLEQFASDFPKEEGTIASKKGNLVKTLQELSQSKSFRLSSTDWNSYAINKERNPIIAQGPTVHQLGNWCANPPVWKTSIATIDNDELDAVSAKNLLSPQKSADLPSHPLRVGSHILFQDGSRLLSFDVVSGAKNIFYDPKEMLPKDNFNKLSSLGRSMALTFCPPNKVLVTLDKPVKNKDGLFANVPMGDIDCESFLACLEVNLDGPRLLWEAKLPSGDSNRFESDPLIHDGRVFVLVGQKVNGREAPKVLCYNLNAGAPDLLWSCEVAGEVIGGNVDESRQSFLTLAGNLVIATSRGGAVTAVDQKTGKAAWLRLVTPNENTRSIKNPTPLRAIFHEAIVYHLNSRSRVVQALDSASGGLIWSRDVENVNQLIAVKDGVLLLGTENGLRGLNATNGLDQQGWSIPSDGSSLPSAGRGFVLGNNYIWPTVKGVFVVDMKTGLPAADLSLFHRLQPGNLFLFDDLLLSVDRSAIRIYQGTAKEKPKIHDEVFPLGSQVKRAEQNKANNSNNNSEKESSKSGDIKWVVRHAGSGKFFDQGSLQVAKTSNLTAIAYSHAFKVVRNSDGTLLWESKLGAICSWMKTMGDTLLLGFDKSVRAFDLEKGVELWCFAPINKSKNPFEFVLLGDRIFCHDGSWKIYCLDFKDGRVLFESHFPIFESDFSDHHLLLQKMISIDQNACIIPDSKNNYWYLGVGISQPRGVPRLNNAPWETMVTVGDKILGLNSDGKLCLMEPQGFQCVMKIALLPASLKTGKPGTIFAFNNQAIVGVEGNAATFLFLIDLIKGSHIWSKPLLIFEKNLNLDSWRFLGDNLYGFAGNHFKSWSLSTQQETKYFELSPAFLLYDWCMSFHGEKILVWVKPPACTKITLKLGSWVLTRNSDFIYPKGQGMPLVILNGSVQKKIFLETYPGGAKWDLKVGKEFHLFPEVSFGNDSQAVHPPKFLLDKNEIQVGLASEVYSLVP